MGLLPVTDCQIPVGFPDPATHRDKAHDLFNGTEFPLDSLGVSVTFHISR